MDDNGFLLDAQRRYLEDGDKKSWEELWTRASAVCGRIAMDESAKRGLHYDSETLHDWAMDACVYVLRRYGGGWKVDDNFISALHNGVIHAMFYMTKGDAAYRKVSSREATDAERLDFISYDNEKKPPCDENGNLLLPFDFFTED